VFKRWKLLLPMMLGMLALLFIGCGATTTTTAASCAYVVGNGINDARVHNILYPNQRNDTSTNEDVKYVACNSRNYIINDGTVFSPNVVNGQRERVGDRFNLAVASTNSSVGITVGLSAFWTLNQSKAAMMNFYEVCHKYNCWTTKDQTGELNFATRGWNGMLAENFGPSLDAAARRAANQVDDSIWRDHNPAQYKLLADLLSKEFSDEIRSSLGYSQDLFCGSGNSDWKDPSKPGEGEFFCSPVRIRIDAVELLPIQGDQNPKGALVVNAQRLEAAKVLYGTDASHWLAVQDTVKMCTAPCLMNIGSSGGGPSIQVPSVTNTAPAPAPATPTRN